MSGRPPQEAMLTLEVFDPEEILSLSYIWRDLTWGLGQLERPPTPHSWGKWGPAPLGRVLSREHKGRIARPAFKATQHH